MARRTAPRAARAAVAIVCAVIAAGCTATTPSTPPGAVVGTGTGTGTGTAEVAPPPPPVPAPDHVVVVVLENKDVDQVVGDDDAPYLTALAGRSAYFTDAHAVAHPSQPNYIALFSGDTHIDDDSCAGALTADSLGGRLLDAGRTFTGYSEDLPETGYTGCSHGAYARKHNPWVDFTDVPPEANRPLSDLPRDYSDLPTVAFVIPNLCHDMHDCGVATGDDWMRQHIEPYVEWASTHNSLLVVTFDESESHQDGNAIVTLFAGPMVGPGSYDERVDHYRVLRTIEDAYGLSPLGHSADAGPITDVWTTAR